MDIREFEAVFGAIKNRWRQQYASVDVVDRIFDHVQSLDVWQFKIIVNQFLDGHRQAPLPRDFQDASKKFKNSSGGEAHYEFRPDCARCEDVGILSLRHKNEGHAAYARCFCDAGKREKYALPIFNRKLSVVYSHGPLGSFDVGMPSNMSGETLVENIFEKAQAWSEKLKIAEQYWGQNGQE